jgi:hypothetical protein
MGLSRCGPTSISCAALTVTVGSACSGADCADCGLAGLGECAKRQARDDHHAGDEDCGAQARRDGLPMDGAGGRELAG